MCLRLAMRGQGPMTPTVMLWVWQVDSKGSEARYNVDDLCLQEIKLKADLWFAWMLCRQTMEVTRIGSFKVATY